MNRPVPLPAEERPGGVLQAVLRACELWKLKPAQECRLLGVGRQTLWRWEKEPPRLVDMSRDTVERMSYLLGIYKALQILLPEPAMADSWLHRPNTDPVFAGQAPIERMLGGKVADLYVVRRYLDGQRGW